MKALLSPARLAKGLWWNRNWPIAEGCSRCSPACQNCFAEEYVRRFESTLPYLRGLLHQDGKWNGVVILREDQLDLPLRTKKPTVWFVAERSDLYHPAVSDAFRDRAYAVMAMAPQHLFLVLTKRPERMAEYFKSWENGIRAVKTTNPNIIGDLLIPLPNVLHGTTVWDQASADRNIPHLLKVPGKRFLSCEPLLGEVDLTKIRQPGKSYHIDCLGGWEYDGEFFKENPDAYSGERIHWVIAGGESIGRKPGRQAPLQAFESLRDQCLAAGVPFFLKQMARLIPDTKLVKAPYFCGRQYLQLPEVSR